MKKQSSTDHITKEDLRVLLNQQSSDLWERMGKSIQILFEMHTRTLLEHFDTTFSKFTDRILTTVDPLLKELETRQQEREVAADQHAQMRNKLNNHEKRIQKLENI